MDDCSKFDHPAHRSEQEQLNKAECIPATLFPRIDCERWFQTVQTARVDKVVNVF